jgi:hypothetical protein
MRNLPSLFLRNVIPFYIAIAALLPFCAAAEELTQPSPESDPAVLAVTKTAIIYDPLFFIPSAQDDALPVPQPGDIYLNPLVIHSAKTPGIPVRFHFLAEFKHWDNGGCHIERYSFSQLARSNSVAAQNALTDMERESMHFFRRPDDIDLVKDRPVLDSCTAISVWPAQTYG